MNAAADFVFHCHRCGLCCRAGHGRVWIGEADLLALAAACGEEPAAFRARRVVAVDGRLSLRERADGCCTLLEDGNRCIAYEARPEACRSFPFWPGILAGGAELERAAGMCPGIQRIPARAVAEAVLPRAAALLAGVEAGAGCGAPAGERWLCSLEADLLLAGAEDRGAAAGAAARPRLERLAEATGYPWTLGASARLLAERAAGWERLRGGPPRLRPRQG